MRRSLLAVAAAVLLLVRVSAQVEDLVYTRFADYLEALRVQMGIPGLAAVLVGRTDVLWERGLGYQNLERALPMRADTPVPIEGLTQTFTAAVLLRCAEEGRLSFDAPMRQFRRDASEPDATARQLLTHTTGPDGNAVFAYAPERIDALSAAVKSCTGDSYRETTANLVDRLAMIDSVPGPDILDLVPPAEGIPTTESARERYALALGRVATPYAVDAQKRTSAWQYATTTLSASKGFISTARDLAQFDLALRTGLLVSPDTLTAAWRAPLDATGKALPHGVGWFVQGYGGETVVWQFGSGGDNGSSAMIVTLPARDITLVLLANSTDLVKSFSLEKGDITKSPFARVFLALFTR